MAQQNAKTHFTQHAKTHLTNSAEPRLTNNAKTHLAINAKTNRTKMRKHILHKNADAQLTEIRNIIRTTTAKKTSYQQ